MNEQVKAYLDKYPSEIMDMYHKLRQMIFESVSCEPEETLWAKLPSDVYYYIKHLLTELPQLIDKNGNIEQSLLEPLMPLSKSLPADCYSKRRN